MIQPICALPPAITATAAPSSISAKIPMGETLQTLLKDTLDGHVSWQRKQTRFNGSLFQDTFLTQSRHGVDVSLNAARSQAYAIPGRLGPWSVRLSQSGKPDRILDGTSMVLPSSVSPGVNETVETLPKLFRAVYDSVSAYVDPWVSRIQHLTDRLKDRMIQANYSRIPPSLAYPAFGMASVLQVGDGDTRLEMTRFGQTEQITLRFGQQTVKLNRDALENPTLYEAVNALIEEANFQRTDVPGQGLKQWDNKN